jgi:osmotically-inducible protein OsmY
VAAVGIFSSAPAGGAPSPNQLHEIVVIANREADAAMSTKVATALREDPYLFSDHVNVTTENGVVRLEGIVRDLPDLFQILRLARRIAGKGKVVNKIDFVPTDVDGN